MKEDEELRRKRKEGLGATTQRGIRLMATSQSGKPLDVRELDVRESDQCPLVLSLDVLDGWFVYRIEVRQRIVED